jgi:hypothetical protein
LVVSGEASNAGPSDAGDAPPRRFSPGVATIVIGVMLATGIGVGASAGVASPSPAGLTAAQTAQARAAVLAALATRTGTPAPVAAPPVAAAPADAAPAASSPALDAPVATADTATTTAADDTADDSTDDADATTPDDDTNATTPDPSSLPLPNVTNAWVLTLPAASINALDLAGAPANYVRDSIVPQGVLLSGYSLLSAASPVNAIAAVSGQPPNLATEDGCTTRADVPASSLDTKTGIITGNGCLFPATAPSLAAQLTDGGSVVRSYDTTTAAGSGCAAAPAPANPRAPLPYFHAFTDDAAACAANTGDQAKLDADLADPSATPKLSWITGPDDPTAAVEFAATELAAITATDAYKAGGLVLLLPDAPDPAATDDLAVGAVAVSPFIPATTQNATEFGPYGVLRLLEDLFTLPALAGAGADGVSRVDRSIFQVTASGARVHHQPTRSSS